MPFEMLADLPEKPPMQPQLTAYEKLVAAEEIYLATTGWVKPFSDKDMYVHPGREGTYVHGHAVNAQKQTDRKGGGGRK